MRRTKSAQNGGCPFGGTGGAPQVSRRAVLAGLTGLAVAPVLGGAAGTAQAAGRGGAGRTTGGAAPGRSRAARAAHGAGSARGSDIAVRAGRGKEARFGLMFKTLPAFAPPDQLLSDLSRRMNDGKAPLSDVKDSDVAYDIPHLPAGYIYFGQFVDHDVTLDLTPLTEQRQDPHGMVNYDTPRFDLGSVYGRGPGRSPELYDPARPGYLRVVEHSGLSDLPRDSEGAAHLGDPRNDENLIVAQLHVVFLRLHNKLRDEGHSFARARQLLIWHYQWIIVHDYLTRLVGPQLVAQLLRRGPGGRVRFAGRFYRPRNRSRPYMPVEFSGAAYRFGHSMIRAEYEVQDEHTVPIFGPDGSEDLRGHRPIPAHLWVDWNYFFEIPGMDSPDDRNMARRIDTELSSPLASLPRTVVAPVTGAITALAERNLLRGKRLGLPAGQDVAVAMGVPPLANADLGLDDPGWGGKAPLWYYVLKEAEIVGGGVRLGPVGGRIVAEVILGLLALDPTSYVNAGRGFAPGSFAMGDLILWADAIDPRARVKAEDPDTEDPDTEDPDTETPDSETP